MMNISQQPSAAPVALRDNPYDLEPPRRARWALRGIMLGLVLLMVWATWGTVDQVTRAAAVLVAADRTQLVQSPDGGVISALHVKEGQTVKAGQLLATLQKERVAAAVADTRAKVAALRITLARLHAEVYGKTLRFEPDLLTYGEYIRNQTDLYNKRQTAFRDDIRSLEGMLVLAEEELRIHRQLEDMRDVSRAEVLRVERNVADIRAQMANKRNKYFQDAQAEMTKAQEDLSTQLEQLRDRSQLLEHTELLAPMDGVVNSVKVTTLGGVVKPGETVIELLPLGNELIVEAKIPLPTWPSLPLDRRPASNSMPTTFPFMAVFAAWFNTSVPKPCLPKKPIRVSRSAPTIHRFITPFGYASPARNSRVREPIRSSFVPA